MADAESRSPESGAPDWTTRKPPRPSPPRRSASWKELLSERVPDHLRRQIETFENQTHLRRQGRIDEKVYAETRLRQGVYGQRYDNGQRHDGVEIDPLLVGMRATTGWAINDRFSPGCSQQSRIHPRRIADHGWRPTHYTRGRLVEVLNQGFFRRYLEWFPDKGGLKHCLERRVLAG